MQSLLLKKTTKTNLTAKYFAYDDDAGGNGMINKYYSSFCEGLAAVWVEGKGWGYINPAGEFVIEPQFGTPVPPDGRLKDYLGKITDFSKDGFVRVYNDGLWNTIDRKGHFLLEEWSETMPPIQNNYLCVHPDCALR